MVLFDGGAMCNYGSGSFTLTNVSFSENSADIWWCYVQFWFGQLTLTNVSFTGNYAYEVGGAMYNRNSDLSNFTLTNVSFSGNSVTDG